MQLLKRRFPESEVVATRIEHSVRRLRELNQVLNKYVCAGSQERDFVSFDSLAELGGESENRLGQSKIR